MPPSVNPTNPQPTPAVTPSSSGFFDVLFYAPARLSDFLRRVTDIKNSSASKKLKMSPVVGLWLTLALVGLIISANSYFLGFQELSGAAAEPLTTVIPLGRADTVFRPMALFPPVLQLIAHVVNFSSWAVGLLIPDIPFMSGTPEWTPTPRPTVWSNATLALAWWVGAFGSVLISSTQGLFTRTSSLSNQRAYAARLNKINAIDLNPKAIAPARREVRKANNYGRSAIWLMCLLACAGWGWELFIANGALDGTTFDTTTRWIYGLASTFMAELCWAIADFSGKKINSDI